MMTKMILTTGLVLFSIKAMACDPEVCEMVGTHDVQISGLQSDVSGLTSYIDGQIATLESNIGDQNSDIANLDSAISANTSSISSHTSTLSTHTGSISDHETRISDLEAVTAPVRRYARITLTSGSPGINAQGPENFISSVTDSGTGTTTVNITASIFSEAPHCDCVSETAGVLCQPIAGSATSVVVRTYTLSSSALTDVHFNLKCETKY